MSPHIGLSIGVSLTLDEARTPCARLRTALRIARDQGIRLASGEHGVEPAVTGGWKLSRRYIPARVNVIGAYLLAIQPDVSTDEDPTVTAARDLGVSLAWIEGAADGWDGEPSSDALGGIGREDYLAGLRAGFAARADHAEECPGCGTWRFPDEAGDRACCTRE